MSKIADTEANATSLDGLVNDNGLITTLRNGPKPSYQYLVDGWNAEIAEAILEMNKSRGFRVVGTFAEGFTYELFNDVGVDVSGDSWIYVGAGAPNKTVSAGTVPSSPDYEQVTFNTAENVQMTSGESVQKFTTQSRQAIEAVYKAQGYNNVFFFEDGFIYTESNDVGIYEDGTAWAYADAGALPVTVAAGTVPSEGVYQAVIVDPSSIKLDNGTSLQEYADDTSSEIEAIKEDYEKPKVDNNTVSRMYSNTLVVGDSFLEGVGASTYTDSYIYKFGRSFFNAQNNGTTNDSGVMYETNANLLKAWSEVGLGATGGGSAGISFEDRGLCDKQLVIPSGDYVEVKLREIGNVGFFYDGTVTTATSSTIELNGELIGSLTLGGTEIGEHSGFVSTPFGQDTEISDTVRITAVGGTLYLSGFTTHKLSSVGGGLYIAPRGGWTFDDFNTADKVEEMGKLLNFNKSTSNRRLMIIALGTNSIYQAGGRNQTPSEYIASLDSLVTNMIAVSNNTTFTLTVPPKANPAIYPVVNTAYTHEDYRDAILDYAETKGFSVIRYDQTILGKAPYSYYSDGLHPNSAGHGIYAAKLCDWMQTPYNPYIKTINFSKQIVRRFEQDVSSFPGSGGAPTIKWVDFQEPIGRVVSARLRNSSGLEVPVESVRDLLLSSGMFYHSQGSGATRFFYQSAAGFARNDGYYASSGLLDGSSTGVTLVVDYI